MKFRVHPSLIVYLVLIGLVDGLSNILCILVTLIVHEAGHLFVGKFFKEEYELLEITPLGGMLSYKAGYSSCKGIKGAAIAAAGPLCNIGMVYLFCILPIHHVLSKEIGTSFIGVNVSMFLINILPVLPLDGGRIVFSIGYYVFPIAQLINLLTALGCVTGVLFTALSVYGLIAIGKLNFSMLAAGGYMVLCAAKEKEILYASAFHTAIQERLDAQSFTRPIQVIAVSERECLASIIPVLCKTKKCIFIVEHHDSPQLITEKQVLGKLLASPLTTFADILSD